jgi:hypothetical protein
MPAGLTAGQAYPAGGCFTQAAQAWLAVQVFASHPENIEGTRLGVSSDPI